MGVTLEKNGGRTALAVYSDACEQVFGTLTHRQCPSHTHMPRVAVSIFWDMKENIT